MSALLAQAKRHAVAVVVFVGYALGWAGIAKLAEGAVFDGGLPGWPVVLGALASLLYCFRLLVLALLDADAKVFFFLLLGLAVVTPFVALAAGS